MSAGRAPIGSPRSHHRRIASTSDRARELAVAGAPHGTLVTAGRQAAGRGRQGREWVAPEGRALLCSLVLRDPPRLLPLAAGVAVAEAVGEDALVKWPNDVLLGGRKVAGILAEGRPQEGWAVLGIGVNVAVRPRDLPAALRGTAGSLGLEPAAVEDVLAVVLERLAARLADGEDQILASFRGRDALAGRQVTWGGGSGSAAGVDGEGRLVVVAPGGGRRALDAGEVHLRLPGHRPG